ncbi:MAG: hypothetical protein JNL50_12200 [Phycisphaerae bacterium]|nr:hypothetical protein [Phycisphaerae bacterium]
MHASRHGISTLKVFLLILAALLLGFCAWSGWLVHWALNATPSISVDYGQKLHELALQGQDASAKNEHETLLRVGATLRQLDDEFQQKYGKPGDAPEEWSAARVGFPVDLAALEMPEVPARAREIAREYLERAGATTLLADLATLRGARLVVRPAAPGALISLLIPELGDARKASRYCRGRAVVAAQAGDWESFVGAITDMRGLSRAVNRDPILIGYLVGIAIDAAAADTLRESIIAHDIPLAALDKLAAVFAEDASRRGVIDAFEAERLMFMDISQRTHDKSGRFIPSAAGGLTGTGGPAGTSPAIANVVAIAMPSRRQTEALAERVYARMKELGGMARKDRRGNPDDHLGIEVSTRYMLLQLMIPAIGKAISAGDQGLQQQRATRIIIALERCRAARGEYPEKLGELVPEFLDAVPGDPYSELGFVYKPGPDRKARASYTLYSVGDDDEDNAGQRALTEHDALRPVGKGKDLVFMPKGP